MSIEEMPVGKMSVREISVWKRSFGEKSVEEMFLEEMPVEEIVGFFRHVLDKETNNYEIFILNEVLKYPHSFSFTSFTHHRYRKNNYIRTHKHTASCLSMSAYFHTLCQLHAKNHVGQTKSNSFEQFVCFLKIPFIKICVFF